MTPSKKKVVGLTGGIASGKSTVSNYLRKCGIAIIDADVIARQVVDIGEPTYQQIVEYFGQSILAADRQIDRKALGAIVFNDEAKLEVLESFTHPAIIAAFKTQILDLQKNSKTPFIVLDIALLFEVGMQVLCDEVWLVVLDRQSQIDRLCQRDGISAAEAARIIDLQMPMTEKAKLADVLIDNNGDVKALQNQIDTHCQRILDQLKWYTITQNIHTTTQKPLQPLEYLRF